MEHTQSNQPILYCITTIEIILGGRRYYNFSFVMECCLFIQFSIILSILNYLLYKANMFSFTSSLSFMSFMCDFHFCAKKKEQSLVVVQVGKGKCVLVYAGNRY